MVNVKAIPEGLHTLTPQLVVDGAAEAIAFYQKAFGAEELSRAPDPSGKKIWHASVRIGNSVFYVNDVFPEMGGTASSAALWLYTENVDALYDRAVKAGAKVEMPLSDMFWGDRTGMLSDAWGNKWNLARRMKDLTPEQMQKAQDAFVAGMKR
jgi:PhnB protein